MVEITPEVRKQLDEAKKQCPFCKIIAGDIPAEKVYSDDKIHGVLDINPWVKGHVLLMPKEHYPIMPYIPAEDFKHLFGKLPKFVKALKKAMLSTGANVVIANGAVAGQQSPHFLIHVLPRESGDKLDLYGFGKKKEIDDSQLKQAVHMLAQNLPIMMNNHFQKNPAEWRKQDFRNTKHLYEDEKVICTLPLNPQCVGHLEVIPKDVKDFEDMNEMDSAHIFYAASICATAVFEGLGAQGSNIILKTGHSGDNDGKVSIHILPRKQDDGLELTGKPMSSKPDNKKVAAKIADETYIVNLKEEKKMETIEIRREAEIMSEKIEKKKPSSNGIASTGDPRKDEIAAAIEAASR
ncbi:HIT family protein [Candidatus Woesearchaeota archaeon]|nr:HIT family protein [Candidatus Woesearchaeota archaeon]